MFARHSDLPRRRLAPLSAALLVLLALLGAPGAQAAPEKAAGGIRFTYTDPNANAVFWAGDFNGWNATATPLTKSGAVWSVTLALPAGTHAYKFVADGQWIADPENGVTAGEFGNSVVTVGADGAVVAQKASSNTPYSPKIFMSGRIIGLYQSILNPFYSRYELTRPEMDVDLGFDVHVSDALTGRMLMNLNPRNEAGQDFQSRLNFKRGSLTMKQPDLELYAFDSENVGTWDDPMHLVGNIGQFAHPFGYQRQGFRVRTPKLGFETELLYSDNFEAGGVTFPQFRVQRDPLPEFIFEADSLKAALGLLETERGVSGFRFGREQASKISATDFGDNGKSFGFGDGNENTFAMRVQRKFGTTWRLGVLGRTDRGFQLGRIVLADAIGDSTVHVRTGQTIQQWYGLGAEAHWQPRPAIQLEAEALFGARRLNLVNGSNDQVWKAGTLNGPGGSDFVRESDTSADGQHMTVDRSQKLHFGGAWVFAQGDIAVRGSAEHEAHHVPAWYQAPIIPPGLAPIDHARVLNVDYQRARYANAFAERSSERTTLELGWDRNWRYYLGREVKTTVDLEVTRFDYDASAAWESQLWFPTGNFWLETGQSQLTPDRLTVLGQSDVVRLRPSIEIPFASHRRASFEWHGTFTGVHLGTQPRYAESLFRLGWDWNPNVRIASDTRWVKYDVPELALGRGYLSTYTGATYRWADGIELSLGFGVDPRVLDPNTNEYASIGRQLYLAKRNANGYIAETDALSLAPQIAAAERALMNERRIQLQAIVHF